MVTVIALDFFLSLRVERRRFGEASDTAYTVMMDQTSPKGTLLCYPASQTNRIGRWMQRGMRVDKGRWLCLLSLSDLIPLLQLAVHDNLIIHTLLELLSFGFTLCDFPPALVSSVFWGGL